MASGLRVISWPCPFASVTKATAVRAAQASARGAEALPGTGPAAKAKSRSWQFPSGCASTLSKATPAPALPLSVLEPPDPSVKACSAVRASASKLWEQTGSACSRSGGGRPACQMLAGRIARPQRHSRALQCSPSKSFLIHCDFWISALSIWSSPRQPQ